MFERAHTLTKFRATCLVAVTACVKIAMVGYALRCFKLHKGSSGTLRTQLLNCHVETYVWLSIAANVAKNKTFFYLFTSRSFQAFRCVTWGYFNMLSHSTAFVTNFGRSTRSDGVPLIWSVCICYNVIWKNFRSSVTIVLYSLFSLITPNRYVSGYKKLEMAKKLSRQLNI